MNVKVEALDQHKVSLAIELPAEAVQKGFKQAVARIANQVRIPGFRKGKASRKVLEMHFGKEAVVAEAKDIVINGALTEAMKQEKIIPITQADVKEDLFSETEGAKFTATFVKRPEVELGEYKGLEAAHEEPEVSDAQVEAELKKQLNRAHASKGRRRRCPCQRRLRCHRLQGLRRRQTVRRRRRQDLSAGNRLPELHPGL